jgi:hypothetical protein
MSKQIKKNSRRYYVTIQEAELNASTPATRTHSSLTR